MCPRRSSVSFAFLAAGLLVSAMSAALALMARGETSPATSPETPRAIDEDHARRLSDREVFLREGGCKPDSDDESFSCPEGSPLSAIGCDRGWVRKDLSTLTPSAPIAECWEYGPFDPQLGAFLRIAGAYRRVAVRLFIADAEGLRALGSLGALRQRFAPVESADEALAFARVATGLLELRNFKRHPGYWYFMEPISDTSVRVVADGYVVERLRDKQVFGCGPHPTSLVTVKVMRDGEVRELSRHLAFMDPNDLSCVD